MKMQKESYNEQRKKQMEEEKLMLRNKENKGTCGCHLSFGFLVLSSCFFFSNVCCQIHLPRDNLFSSLHFLLSFPFLVGNDWSIYLQKKFGLTYK